jgi:septum formation protein
VAPNRSAEQQAVEFAAGKAKSCIELFPDALILGSDTLISLGSEVLGKPADLADAESMLRRMAGTDAQDFHCGCTGGIRH